MKHTVRGFTLVELLVVLTIIGIAAGLGLPSLREAVRNNRVANAAASLQSSLNLARSEAINRTTVVTVAPNLAANAWQNGWTVFIDGTGTGNSGVAPVVGDGPEILEVITLTGAEDMTHGFGGNGDEKFFSFNAMGRAITSAGAAGNKTFWFEEGDSKRRCILLNTAGRTRVELRANNVACSNLSGD